MSEPARRLRLVPSPSEEVDPLVGRTLDDRYQIEAVLGRGGMGMVYRARHTFLNKPLAVKVLKAEVSKSEAVIARFEREARAASAIGSRHICDVIDFGTMRDGATYLVMELLNGPSLSAVMEAGEPMPTERLLSISTQLCDALGAAHANGIVHRDLKPDNVHLVTEGSQTDFVKVLDFGIAKVANGAEAGLTQAGEVFGTPRYMSPEQCAGLDVDHRTDLYALGIMMYEMACGQVPFDADNLMGLLTKQVYERPIPPRELAPPVDVAPGLEAVILRCLEKSPAARYNSMAELRADLETLQMGGTPRALVATLDKLAPARRSAPRARPASLPALELPAAVAVPASPARSRGPLYAGLVMVGVALLTFAVAFFAWPAMAPRGSTEASDVTASDVTASDVTASDVTESDVTASDATETDATETDATENDTTDGTLSGAASVELTSFPEGAEVYGPDGELIGNTPLSLERPEVAQTYRVELPGQRARRVQIGPDTQATLHLRFRTGRPPRVPPVVVGSSHDPGPSTVESHDGTSDTTPSDWSTDPVENELLNPFGDNARRRVR